MDKSQEVEAHGGLELKNLSVPGRLGRGLSGYFYETTWGGKKCVRKDFPLGSAERNSVFECEVKKVCKLDDHPNVVKCFGYALGKISCSLVQEYVADNLQNSVQRRIDQEVIRKMGASTPGPSRVLKLDEIKRLVSSRGKEKKKGKGKVADAGAFEAVPEAADIISQIATGMRHLHENGVVHGDLKPRNVLVLNSDQSSGWKVKLADYGLAETKKRIRMVSERTRRAEILTWKAPECLGKKNLNHGSLDDDFLTDSDTDSDEETEVEFLRSKLAMADVYSFGLTCSYILGGKPMSSDMSLTQLRQQRIEGFKPKLPESAFLEDLKLVIGACLEPEPMKRPTFSMICVMKDALSHLRLQMLMDVMEGRRRESVPQIPSEVGLSGSLQDLSVYLLDICNTMSTSSGAPREVSHSSFTFYERICRTIRLQANQGALSRADVALPRAERALLRVDDALSAALPNLILFKDIEHMNIWVPVDHHNLGKHNVIPEVQDEAQEALKLRLPKAEVENGIDDADLLVVFPKSKVRGTCIPASHYRVVVKLFLFHLKLSQNGFAGVPHPEEFARLLCRLSSELKSAPSFESVSVSDEFSDPTDYDGCLGEMLKDMEEYIKTAQPASLADGYVYVRRETGTYAKCLLCAADALNSQVHFKVADS